MLVYVSVSTFHVTVYTSRDSIVWQQPLDFYSEGTGSYLDRTTDFRELHMSSLSLHLGEHRDIMFLLQIGHGRFHPPSYRPTIHDHLPISFKAK